MYKEPIIEQEADKPIDYLLEERSAQLAALHAQLEIADQTKRDETEKQFHHEVMEALLELSLLYGEKRDEGRDGVILEVNIEAWPQSIKEKFLEHFFADDEFPRHKWPEN